MQGLDSCKLASMVVFSSVLKGRTKIGFIHRTIPPIYSIHKVIVKDALVQKVIDFIVFLMLGVTAAESFSNGHASLRVLYGHPKRPLIVDDIAPLWLSWLGLWIGAALLIATIYLLANRRVSGWYVGMIGGLSVLVASGVTHYFRHATNDYLYGALMGLSIAVLLFIPAVKQQLLEGPPSEAKQPQTQVLQAKPA